MNRLAFARGWHLARGNPVKTLVALGIVGIALFLGGRQVYGWWQFRAAEHALRQAEHDHFEQNLTQALAHLDRYLEIHPSSIEGQLLAARTARRLSAFDQARTHLQQAEKLGAPADQLGLEIDLQRAQQGEIRSVEARLKDLVDQYHPESSIILEAMVPGYVKTYQLPRALICLNLWVKLEPDNVHALYQRGQVNRLLDRFEESMDDYRRATELDPTDDASRQALAESLIYANKADEAASLFRALLQAKPHDPALTLGLARCRLLLGETDEARWLLDGRGWFRANVSDRILSRRLRQTRAGSPLQIMGWN